MVHLIPFEQRGENEMKYSIRDRSWKNGKSQVRHHLIYLSSKRHSFSGWRYSFVAIAMSGAKQNAAIYLIPCNDHG
jgi:hypothetical protein